MFIFLFLQALASFNATQKGTVKINVVVHYTLVAAAIEKPWRIKFCIERRVCMMCNK